MLASALLAACAVIASVGGLAPVPVIRPPALPTADRPALAPVMTIRLEAEAAWLLDPQLCLDAFVWFHTAAWPIADDVVHCWQ